MSHFGCLSEAGSSTDRLPPSFTPLVAQQPARTRHAAGERYAQMAVLVRSAEHARAIAAALMAAGVPVTSQAEA